MLEGVDGLAFAQRLLAMSYAQLGETKKAQSQAKRYLEQYPDFTISRYMADIALQREEDRTLYAEGLEKAGFPG